MEDIKLKKTKLVLLIALLFALTACGSKEPETQPVEEKPTAPTVHGNENDPIATLTMEDGSVIEIQLYAETAPNTVRNFIALANSGFYDGLIFHRVIPGFMIQGGDPEGTGMGGPGHSIKGEFSNNGFENTLTHERGVISMARSRANDSAGSQFFIMHQDSPHLDGDYAAFGKVIKGIEIVDAIVSVETESDMPTAGNEQRIKSITVDTKGVEFEAPKKM